MSRNGEVLYGGLWKRYLVVYYISSLVTEYFGEQQADQLDYY